jgi:hypothetical protein
MAGLAIFDQKQKQSKKPRPSTPPSKSGLAAGKMSS